MYKYTVDTTRGNLQIEGNLYQNSNSLVNRNGKDDPQFIWNYQWPLVGKIILKKKKLEDSHFQNLLQSYSNQYKIVLA